MEQDTLLNQLDNHVDIILKKLRESNSELARVKEDLKHAHAELVELQKKYDNLKIAQACISLSNNDIKQAKLRLKSMLNTVDRCIIKLSE